MAQNLKAKSEQVRENFLAAVETAKDRLKKARGKYFFHPTPANEKSVDVALQELSDVRDELKKFDARPKLPKPRQPRPSKKFDEKTLPLPPPVMRPKALHSTVVTTPTGKKERLSWWVGRDRAELGAGSSVLRSVPPKATSEPLSKLDLKTASMRESAERAASKLQSTLKPTAGDFRSVPKSE
jgi:hypothetical protein